MTDLTARRARWAVAAVFFANGTIVGTWAAQIPLVQERLAISHSTLGLSLLTMALGALIAMPLAGQATARFGSAAVTRASTIALLATFPLPLLAPAAPLLMAALLVFGAANGVMDVAMNAHGVAAEGRYGRPIMSSLHGMWSLGGLVGAGLAALLLPLVPALAEGLIATAAMAVVGIAGLFHLLPASADNGPRGKAFALPGRATIGLGLLCFLCMMSEGAVLDWGALHLKDSLGTSPGLAAAGFAAFSGSMATSRFCGDFLRGRMGNGALVQWSASLATLGVVVALTVPVAPLAIAGFGLVGLGLANLVPVFFGAAGRIPGEAPGTAIAAVATLGYFGFLAGPPVIGFVADLTTLAIALGMIVVATLTIAATARAVLPR